MKNQVVRKSMRAHRGQLLICLSGHCASKQSHTMLMSLRAFCIKMSAHDPDAILSSAVNVCSQGASHKTNTHDPDAILFSLQGLSEGPPGIKKSMQTHSAKISMCSQGTINDTNSR